MSRTELFKILPDGEWEPEAVYGNSWGWSPYVWDKLVESHGLLERAIATNHKVIRWAGDTGEVPYGVMDCWSYLWDLVKDKKVVLEPFELLVLRTTYDAAALKQGQFPALIEALRQFQGKHGTMTTDLKGGMSKRVCHLSQMADDLQKLVDNDEALLGVCWYGTSTIENRWYPRNPDFDEEAYMQGTEYDGEEEIKYNFLKREDLHFWVSEEEASDE